MQNHFHTWNQQRPWRRTRVRVYMNCPYSLQYSIIPQGVWEVWEDGKEVLPSPTLLFP
ncbi:hypothetical protein [Nostoc sp. C052]|uniref:hypothetical protein n=1 Tax=Nostoc sp. C052 TaxID=2576902 RepID=UPI0015C34960|nr:hypothetical protein [Nostoc sp. C052]